LSAPSNERFAQDGKIGWIKFGSLESSRCTGLAQSNVTTRKPWRTSTVQTTGPAARTERGPAFRAVCAVCASAATAATPHSVEVRGCAAPAKNSEPGRA